MSQNLITLTVTPEELTAIDAVISDLESKLHGLVDLSIPQRRSARKMGKKSEQFCRLTLNTMEINPQVVPQGVDLADAKADLNALDLLRPRFERLHRLSKRATDSEMALGNDVMSTALQGYALLKAIGAFHGLDDKRKVLGTRFSKSTRAQPEGEAAETITKH